MYARASVLWQSSVPNGDKVFDKLTCRLGPTEALGLGTRLRARHLQRTLRCAGQVLRQDAALGRVRVVIFHAQQLPGAVHRERRHRRSARHGLQHHQPEGLVAAPNKVIRQWVRTWTQTTALPLRQTV